MKTAFLSSVFLCLQKDLIDNDWDRLYAAFVENQFHPIKQVSPSPDFLLQTIAFYHPDAAVILPDWETTSNLQFSIELFTAVAPILPTVTIITRKTYPWIDQLFQPPLHQYVTSPFDAKEPVLWAKQAIEANRIDDQAKTQIIIQARELWDKDQAEEAGKLIFERIPRCSIPAWAAHILEVVYPYFSPSPRIDAVLELARNPQILANTEHEAKLKAHHIVDDADPFRYIQPMPWEHLIFYLAKNVGKVTYNMYGFSAPFDIDAGWELARVLKEITKRSNDPSLEVQAWEALCNPAFILLKLPWLAYPFSNKPTVL